MIDEKTCEKCGSPECHGPDECVERSATKHVIDLLTKAHGQEVAEFWAWEMTPMPMAFPSDDQLGQGLRMAFSPRVAVDEARAKNAAEMDAASRAEESLSASGIKGAEPSKEGA